jgi:CRISPR-associated endonuclease/helicase Cas3
MNSEFANVIGYWGKADPAFGPSAWHPLVFHSLDVAAVARAYLSAQPRLRNQLCRWLGLSESDGVALLTAVAALHDLGKFGENFQGKRSDLLTLAFPKRAKCVQIGCSLRHDAVGALFVDSGHFMRVLQAFMSSRTHQPTNLQSLIQAACGHHGMPAGGNGNSDDAMSPTAQDHAALWCSQVFETCGVTVDALLTLCGTDSRAISIASWWLAGLTVLADWIGSNTAWFPYAKETERALGIEDYWRTVALPRAKVALRESGVLACIPAPCEDLHTLFPSLANYPPSPAQSLCCTLPIGDRPQLVLLEDATGAGKTEAALVFAQRLMSAGLADGIFFGLPTQATADQMYERVDAVGPRLFAAGESIAIVLAHGQRDQNTLFRQRRESSQESTDDAETASQHLSAWLAQGSKRALLAQIGVGTIDQAQLAGLRVKHQPLRLLGLFGKVLIVDEVHAYDSYMQTVLCSLLEAHAAAGGSAILLSATLPLQGRQRLFGAFDRGSRWLNFGSTPRVFGGRRVSAVVQSPTSTAYPLLTRYCAGDDHCEEIELAANPAGQRELRIDYRHSEDEINTLLIAAQREGRAACWIRNSVAEAIATYDRLRSRLQSDRVILFHSRFALCDRLRIQRKVLRHFDRDSTHELRAGWIVIATQVIEQSLDVDFDVMVSDLAPIDALLQRQGRLCRHARNICGERLGTGADERGQPVLTVFGPDRTQPPMAGTIRGHSAATAIIYPAHGQLWLTAQVLGERLALPDDFRRTVEAVYDGDAMPPECFERADERAIGEQRGAQFSGERNTLRWLDGYRIGGDWQDDNERIGTRLGDSVEAILMTWDGECLAPYAADEAEMGGPAERYARSAIRLPGHWQPDLEAEPSDARLAQAVKQTRSTLPFLKHRLLVPLRGGEASLAAKSGKPLELQYDTERGLRTRLRKEPRGAGK